jgi:hypothetical protein
MTGATISSRDTPTIQPVADGHPGDLEPWVIEPFPGFEYGMTVRVKSDASAELGRGALAYTVAFHTESAASAKWIGYPVDTPLCQVEYEDGSDTYIPPNHACSGNLA